MKCRNLLPSLLYRTNRPKKTHSVEVVINNYDDGGHPWHMHGHQFQVVYRGEANTPMYDGTQKLSAVPARRDVTMLNANSSSVWRFQANNPGVYLIHWFVLFLCFDARLHI